jgi:hypothetical protein
MERMITMPSDYISKSALITVLQKRSDELMDEHFPKMSGTLMGAIGLIDQQPTLDLVPAPVKCEECKYYEVLHCGICKCPKTCRIEFPKREPTDFCSYGKRKDGAK